MVAKKVHWASTPEGRARMGEIMRERHAAAKRATGNGKLVRKIKLPKLTKKEKEQSSVLQGPSVILDETAIHYAFGYVTGWLETFEQAINVPRGAVATRISELLRLKASGDVRRVARRVPNLR